MLRAMGVLVIAGGLSSGCATARATAFHTPRERVTECEQLCAGLGLRMSALVVISSSSGCVCEPSTPQSACPPKLSTVSSAAVLAAHAARQAEEESQLLLVTPASTVP